METGGRIVTGSVTTPAAPVPEIIVIGGVRSVVFSPVAGAAGYLVDADTDRSPARIVTDTVVPLRYDREQMFLPPNPKFRVIALDPNLFRYASDTTVASAGLTGALGVFGAATGATLSLPTP
jgi:hypothetical protein